ncbi:hypothetical protein M717_09385 [Neisseria gonorrhoeae SK33414]|uniref:Uncharacterized protein n=1 Tax=Neisseria gonorrhoeae 3502 TaxID=1193404 RepID=A0AA44ZHN6_NEIGO|nr:hypothetical protein T556_11630 [Neisseria gonorrhoeae NG-k51.05]KLR76616.1 hypothetical protein M717_09385 [Neisseria gonorrhoeae SK33414]KLR79900.1 hypothetical protein M679_11160 [Neisseria gonorrhoeae SK7842]KLR81510.1 hypothetical protein M680_06140 [Neisseria gonorrhoeae SK8976]KLR87482.1 hypothetical protein M675_05620 [Neisseria gonorrhoeae SK1902]KLR89755.1 hypothetical protein M677_08170 [Neisseria gonorrhoeae SK6987]KLR90730.1 hypothetical protein M702_08470 [Neisseria gonorrhoe
MKDIVYSLWEVKIIVQTGRQTCSADYFFSVPIAPLAIFAENQYFIFNSFTQ